MKRKFFSVLFALVLALSLSLITAVPAAASPGAGDVAIVVQDQAGNPIEGATVNLLWDATWGWMEEKTTDASGSATFTAIDISDYGTAEAFDPTTANFQVKASDSNDAYGGVYTWAVSDEMPCIAYSAATEYTFTYKLVMFELMPASIVSNSGDITVTLTLAEELTIGGDTLIGFFYGPFETSPGGIFQAYPNPEALNGWDFYKMIDTDGVPGITTADYVSATVDGTSFYATAQAEWFGSVPITIGQDKVIAVPWVVKTPVTHGGLTEGEKDAAEDLYGFSSSATFDYLLVLPVEIEGDTCFYPTIQDAINNATEGDTISVAAGAYAEQVVIDKSLTLQGAGKDVVTVTGTVRIKASDTTVDGFRVEGTVYVDDSVSAITDATISNNYITGASYGVRVGTASENIISQLTIEYNEIIGNDDKGICFWKVDWQAGKLYDVTIRGNTISSNADTGISTYGAGPYIIIGNTVIGNDGNGISIKYDDGDVIRGNTVKDNTAMGINMHQVTNCVVENNTVSGQISEEVVTWFWGDPITAGKGSGIYIHEASENNIIRYNDITGNKYGILISREVEGDDPSGNSINFNSIAENTYYGVLDALVDPHDHVDATHNWWGDVAGPDTWGNIMHNPYEGWAGNAVSNKVDYLPWLIRVDLAEGWNIVSFPIMGEEQVGEPPPPPDGVVAAYWFDSFTQSWNYDPYQAGPLDAMYIKVDLTELEITPPISLIYPVSSEPTFPSSKEMKVGWNFVGLAQLYEMESDDALYDAFWGTGETGLIGYNKVISPSLNGDDWSYVLRIGEESETMSPLKGYWVFMVNDGTLGGFTSTPIVEVEGGG